MADFSDIRLLVVDDEIALRSLLAEVLTDDGFNVRTAESGEDALSQFENEPADIILSDMSMPGMSGIDLLKKVKELRGEHVEFVIITANATLDTAILATKHGAVDYLRKPVDDIAEISRLAERLATRVRERRDKERMVSGLLDIARTLVGPSADPFLVRVTDGVIERLSVPPDGLVLSAAGQGPANIPLGDGISIRITRTAAEVRLQAEGAGDVKPLRIDGVPAKEAVLHGGEHLHVANVDFRFVNPVRLPDSDRLLASAAKLFGQGEKRADTKLTFTGRLEEVGLPNLLQMMNLLNKNGVLEVKDDGGGTGEMHIKDGELVHARLSPVEGKKAVQRMLAWNKGSFVFEQKTVDGAKRTIDERTDALLLDGVRLLDELRALGKAAPPRTLRIAVQNRPPDLSQEERSVLDAVSRFGLVGTILDKSPLADADILKTLIRFRKEGAISVVA